MDRKLLEQIDACRTPQDVRALAERRVHDGECPEDEGGLAAVLPQAEQLVALDGAVREAVHDVPVPTGLAERILASLREAAPSEAVASGTSARKVNDAEAAVAAPLISAVLVATHAGDGARTVQPMLAAPLETRPAPRWQLRSRRGAVGAIAFAAACALVLLGVGFWSARNRQPVDAEQVAEWVHHEQNVLAGIAVEWNFLPDQKPPAALAAPVEFPLHADRWTQRRVQGNNAVIYDWPNFFTAQVRLYVIARRTRAGDLPGQMPWRPIANTGGRCIGVWASGDVVYAIVVEGRCAHEIYSQLVRPGMPT